MSRVGIFNYRYSTLYNRRKASLCFMKYPLGLNIRGYFFRDTQYTPEELMAMILEAAKETASEYAGRLT